MMSLLCTAQTVWNKGLKKHWFPIVVTYGTCIMGRWTCLWSGTCKIIIIILHHKVTNNLISADLEIIRGGGGWLTDFKWQAIGVPICRERLYEGETLTFIFQYFSLKIAFVFVSSRQKKLSNETTTYFSIYTQVCYDHVLSLELSIKTILKHYIQRSWVINIWLCDATLLKDKSPGPGSWKAD